MEQEEQNIGTEPTEKNEPKEKDYDPSAYKPETVYAQNAKSGFGRTFLIVVGIIAVIIIILIIGAIIALIVIKPLGVDVTKLPSALLKMNSDAPSSYDHPLLTAEQEKMLEAVGIDTKSLPTAITPEQEKCATDALGKKRVDEIKAGASPTLAEILAAKGCY